MRLPLNRTAVDAGCDQGYGSERSPEDELPPPLPQLGVAYPAEAAALGLGPSLSDFQNGGGVVGVPAATSSGFEFSFVTPGKWLMDIYICSLYIQSS